MLFLCFDWIGCRRKIFETNIHMLTSSCTFNFYYWMPTCVLGVLGPGYKYCVVNAVSERSLLFDLCVSDQGILVLLHFWVS